VRRGGRHRAALIVESLSTIPPSELQSAVRALADPGRTVLLTGGYFSHLIARYFSIQLGQIRSHVHYVAEPAHRDIGYLLESGKRHLLVIFDLRRYEQEARVAVREARKRGATTIVITDEWLSPAAATADIVLPVAVRAEPFDSLTAVLCLVESMIPALVSAIGPSAIDRMRAWEELDARRHLLDASLIDDQPAAD
jgi:DNA-binding MurR/RpiR family transcriptional regulator